MPFEQDFIRAHGFLAACDEVGRGPLAGPVVAATVFFSCDQLTPPFFDSCRELGITDSKKLSAHKRANILNELQIDLNSLSPDQKYSFSVKNCAGVFSIHEISNCLIDEINILNASLLAMKNSFLSCWTRPEEGILLIDGNKLPQEMPPQIDCRAIVGGDGKSSLIGLASIIAKEYRDNLMRQMDLLYPGYGFAKHAGYPTMLHRQGIERLGICPIHRKSFKGVREFVS